MAFADGLVENRRYMLYMPWGVERVTLLGRDKECLRCRDCESALHKVFRLEAVQAYACLEEPREQERETPPGERIETVPEEDRPADGDELPPPTGVPKPAQTVFDPEPVRQHGYIASFFASPLPNGGNGYVVCGDSPVFRPAQAKSAARRYFFHITQVRERNLYAYLKSLPVPPVGENGRRAPVQLPVALHVSFVLGDNRRRTDVGQPVADDIRLTEAGRRVLCEQGNARDAGMRYVSSKIAYFDEYKIERMDALVCRLFIPEEGQTTLVQLTEENIVNPFLKRYMGETRPQSPNGLAFAVDVFRRERLPGPESSPRRQGALVAAHASMLGEKPWSEADEARWLGECDADELARWEAYQKEDFDHTAYEIRLLPEEEADKTALVYDDGSVDSAQYRSLPPWTEEK